MKISANYKFNLPESNDAVLIDDLTSNFEKLDKLVNDNEKLSKLNKTEISDIKIKVTDLEVKVNNIMDSGVATPEDIDKINKQILDIKNTIGDKNNLQTTDKTNLVAAINEVNSNAIKTIIKQVDPTFNDKNYKVSQVWFNELTGDMFRFKGLDKNNNAIWAKYLQDEEVRRAVIYGFEVDENNLNPRTAVTYIGENVSYTPMKVSNYGSWEKLVKDISTPVLLKSGKVQYELQYDDFTKKKDGSNSILTGSDGDVMIRFKHLWVKEEKVSSTKRRVWLSDKSFDGATSYTKMTEKGYNQLSWGILMTLQHLYLLLYKDRDSQTALGRGYVDGNSDFTSTGGANTKPYFFGETTGKQQMKFCGIESFWDNKYNWIDGIVSDSNYDLRIGYTNFNDSGSGYKLIKTPMTSNVYGYFKSTMGGEAGYILTDKAGSSSTGYCDSGDVDVGRVARFGGERSNGANAGAFSVRLHASASVSHSLYGARLCFVDDDYFYVGAYTGYVEGSKLRSISGKIPTGDKKIGEFRTYAQNNN